MELRYISAQPASDYYAWQVEVYLTNFLSLGIDPTTIDVIGGYQVKVNDNWIKLKETFPEVNFHFYKDTRKDKSYIPSIQPHLLKKHFSKYTNLNTKAFFYHDCDFIFTSKMDFSPYLNDDKWYFSDTISYIGANYIKSKSPKLLTIMCNVVGISESLVEANESSSGGAQKLMKNLDSEYWESVELISNELFRTLSSLDLNKYKSPNDPYVLQIWCASMWAELWLAWKFGHVIEVPSKFDFAFAIDNIERWDQVKFFHNAGVSSSSHGLFYKADYMDKLPYKLELDLDVTKCSLYYFNEVKRAGFSSNLEVKSTNFNARQEP